MTLHVSRISPALLILDLDNTLIYASQYEPGSSAQCVVGEYAIAFRPYVHSFLATCQKRYRLAIWSSASEHYVNGVLEKLAPRIDFAFVWSRARCTLRNDTELRDWLFTKPLKKVQRLGWPLERMLIVEDKPENVQANYGNAVYVTPFSGEPDSELYLLGRFLTDIKDVPNFRKIEKRDWQRRYAHLL